MRTHQPNGLVGEPKMEVLLDGLPVEVPSERRSLGGIRCYLEALALQQQRILCSLNVDDPPTAPAAPAGGSPKACTRVVGITMALEHIPLSMIQTARRQTAEARASVDSTLVLVTINAGARARELWWEVAQLLTPPVVTLSLLSEASLRLPVGKVGLLQLRKWQLEQLACVIGDVDQVAATGDSLALSEALEHRVLPWLDSLEDSLQLLEETFLTGLAAAASAP